MSPETTPNAATEPTTAASAKKAAPRPKAKATPAPKAKKPAPSPKAKAAPAGAKKATAAAPAANGAAKKGLRKPQIRILAALAKAPEGLTRAELSAKAPVDLAACVEYVGSTDDGVRLANDTKHFPSLVSLGLVKHATDEERGMIHLITAAGRKALEKATAAEKEGGAA